MLHFGVARAVVIFLDFFRSTLCFLFISSSLVCFEDNVLIFYGEHVFNDFNREKIINNIKSISSTNELVNDYNIYYVKFKNPLNKREKKSLEEILQAKNLCICCNQKIEDLTCISHQFQKNPHSLLPDVSKKFSRKGLKIFPSKTCLAPQKTVCTPFLKAGEKCGLRKSASENKKHPCSSHLENDQRLVVTPRLGMISPWSSKIGDILSICGLKNIERIERAKVFHFNCIDPALLVDLHSSLYDPMQEMIWDTIEKGKTIFQCLESSCLMSYDLRKEGKKSIEDANEDLGLALSKEEVEFLYASYLALDKNPTDVELMNFAQVNSEHCRHKVFNSSWKIDKKEKKHSLFEMIKNTSKKNPKNLLSAYQDNGAVIEEYYASIFYSNPFSNIYEKREETVPIVLKVETHNHPTSIAPFPGAATGVGGEIRDEGATGKGGRSKAGLCGFCVSNLEIPTHILPWETKKKKPKMYASPLNIMMEGPLGSARFGNEFGRPNLIGYFRTYEVEIETQEGREVRGFYKPIMLAGGVGNIREGHVRKDRLEEDDLIIVLGGPSFLIGIGGGDRFFKNFRNQSKRIRFFFSTKR